MKHCRLSGMAVRAPYQGQGAGRHLLDFAFARSRENQFDPLLASTCTVNSSLSKALASIRSCIGLSEPNVPSHASAVHGSDPVRQPGRRIFAVTFTNV